MNGLLGRVLDAVYPMNLSCWLCGEEARLNDFGLCEACAGKLIPAEERIAPGLDGLSCAAAYTQEMAGAVHRFKYQDQRWLCHCFAKLLSIPDDWHIGVIVPVPLSAKKRRQRGYNQSELLARSLGDRLSLPIEEALLVRMRDTGTQTRLTAAQRAENMAGAFKAHPAAAGARILLVDDVCTTGATLSQCAFALREAGAEAVFAAATCSAELEAAK